MPRNTESSQKGVYFALVLTLSVNIFGTAVAFLSATGVTTNAGGAEFGAVMTGLYLAITAISAGVAVPFAPQISHRIGVRETVLYSWAGVAIMWFIAGLMVSAKLDPLLVVMFTAPLNGALGGLGGVLSTVMLKAYFSSLDFSALSAKLFFWKGLGFGLGGLFGGLFIAAGNEGTGMLIAAAVKIPLVIVLLRYKPEGQMRAGEKPKLPWHEIPHAFRESPQLVRTTIGGVMMAMFIVPAMSLAVPITQDLRHTPLYEGAGFLMAGFAVGEMLSPRLVSLVKHRSTPLFSALLLGSITGAMLIVLGLVSLLLTREVELAVWVVVGAAIGAVRFASRAFSSGSLADSRGHDKAASSIASSAFVVSALSPLGILLWSVALGGLGSEITIVLAGTLAIVLYAVLLATSRRSQVH